MEKLSEINKRYLQAQQDIQAVRDAISNSITLHRVSIEKRCTFCEKQLTNERVPIVFFDKLIYAHKECILEFNNYNLVIII